MAQRKFRSDDTSPWIEGYGSGKNGIYAPGASETFAPPAASCTGTGGTNTLSATHGYFANFPLCILIHQTRGTGAGVNYEFNVIASYVAGTITTKYPLMNTYGAGAQVMVLYEYSAVTLGAGVVINPAVYNGAGYGILPFLCNGVFTNNGSMLFTNYGFIGGHGQVSASIGTNGVQGDGEVSAGNFGHGQNNSGGGGGTQEQASSLSRYGGAGGAALNNGANGGNSQGFSGVTVSGGNAINNTALTTISLGGGGGSGVGDNSNFGDDGGRGSGIGIVIAKIWTGTGSIVLDGGQGIFNGGGNQATNGGGGGAGAFLGKGQTVTLASMTLTAPGGKSTDQAPISHPTIGPGGNGGDGNFHFDYYGTISGSSTQSFTSTKDGTLGDKSPAVFFL